MGGAQEKIEREGLVERIAEEEEILKQHVEQSKELAEESDKLKKMVALKDEQIAQEEVKFKNIEVEKGNLEGLFEHEAQMKKLEAELHEAKEELKTRTERKLELKKNFVVLERQTEEYSEPHEMVKNLAVDKSSFRDSENNLREVKKKQT